jgi:hypothetical protein
MITILIITLMKKYFTVMMALAVIAIFYLIIHRNYIQFNSTVSIKNTHWKKVHIQVRNDYNPDLHHHELIFDQYLTLGQSRTFTVDNADNILYRRDTDPTYADGTHFTNWTHANTDSSATCTVNKP